MLHKGLTRIEWHLIFLLSQNSSLSTPDQSPDSTNPQIKGRHLSAHTTTQTRHTSTKPTWIDGSDGGTSGRRDRWPACRTTARRVAWEATPYYISWAIRYHQYAKKSHSFNSIFWYDTNLNFDIKEQYCTSFVMASAIRSWAFSSTT
jgi:hypothetical protein